MALTKVIGAGAEGLTLSSTSLTIANGLTLTDGNVTLASGHGIDFSANSSASGMSSELFDHYEEGTFDVTIRDATSGGNTGSVTQTNKYVRIGNKVFYQFNLINITTTGMTSSNVLYFTGLPFTPASGSNGSGTGLTTHLNVKFRAILRSYITK